MKGYKVFNPDWTCKGFKFEVGKTFEENVKPKCCKQGFHFCTKAVDCFNYYGFDSKNKVAEVEAIGEVDTEDGDTKCCTNKIRIIREINWQEVLELVNLGKGCTGYHNSGDYNSGNYNNGCFNTKESKIFIFNKISNLTYRDWSCSNAKHILNEMPKNVIKWIYVENMTDKEKEEHPEYTTTNGFLKQIEKEKERQTWWNELSIEEKEVILNIPNFDKKIFKKITGIDVEEVVI